MAHEPGRIMRLLDAGEWGTRLDDFDPVAVQRVREIVGHFFGTGKYFPTAFDGWGNVPDTNVMVVANHSGGMMIPDAWALGLAWYDQFGLSRPLHPMAHELVFSTPITAARFARLGALRASRQLAEEVLSEWGRDLIVFPGGDMDTFRPYRDRYKVQFAGRTGYARIALRARVPILPIAHAGSHETLIVLTDGNRLAKKFRLHEIARADVWPIHLSFPWGISFGPMPHIPLPTKLRYKVGKPVPLPADLLEGEEPTEGQVLAYDALVREHLQVLLDQLKEEDDGWQTRTIGKLKALRTRVRRSAQHVLLGDEELLPLAAK